MLKIYQLHQEEDTSKLDATYVPMHEPTASFWEMAQEIRKENHYAWGLFDDEVTSRTGIKGNEFTSFINDNPQADVWFMGPHYEVEINQWVKADTSYPGISKIPNLLFQLAGNDIDVTKISGLPTCNRNYFVGNEKFWNLYFEVIDNMIEVCQSNADLNHVMFEEDVELKTPYFLHVLENMFPTIIRLSPEINSAGLMYKP